MFHILMTFGLPLTYIKIFFSFLDRFTIVVLNNISIFFHNCVKELLSVLYHVELLLPNQVPLLDRYYLPFRYGFLVGTNVTI